MSWQRATLIEIVEDTAVVTSLVFDLADRPVSVPGGHVDVRRTDPAGRQITRSYWVASAPEDGFIVLTVERRRGEMSRYLVGVLRVGDSLELRDHRGGNVVWTGTSDDPVMLIAEGIGIVPFRSILRHRTHIRSEALVKLVYSVRGLEDVIYRDELLRLAAYDELDVRFAIRSGSPGGWRGRRGPVDRSYLQEVAWSVDVRPLIYVCGASEFAAGVASDLVALGHDADRIRVETYDRPGVKPDDVGER